MTRLEYNRVGWLASHCWSFVIGITFDSVFCGCDGVIDRQTTVYKSIFAIITAPRAAKMQSESTDKRVAGSEASVERELLMLLACVSRLLLLSRNIRSKLSCVSGRVRGSGSLPGASSSASLHFFLSVLERVLSIFWTSQIKM